MFGSVALSGKILLVRIVENIKSDVYFRAGKGKLFSEGMEKGLGLGPLGLELPAGPRNRKKHFLKLFSIILDPALKQEVHLIQIFC